MGKISKQVADFDKANSCQKLYSPKTNILSKASCYGQQAWGRLLKMKSILDF